MTTHAPTRLDDAARLVLQQALFSLEDEYEYSIGSNHKQIRTLRAIRNVLLDDIGWNENLPGSRYPFVESVAATIREKRRAGNPDAFRVVRPGCRLRSQNVPTDDALAIELGLDGSDAMGDTTGACA